MALEITELHKTGAERYVLSFSDGSTMKTMFSVVADFSLYAGRALSQEEYEALCAASERSRARDRAMRMISARPMSERELYDRLVEKGEREQNAADCVAWLKELHFLSDEDYADMLVRHYAAKGYGLRRVRDELYRHKLPRELWEPALAAMPEQNETIDRLLRARLKSAEPDRAELKRATDALLRRGFSWEEIRGAVSRFRAGIEDEYGYGE